MSKGLKKYPQVGSPDRFDAIIAQGTSMRRRRRVLGATGTGVTVAACVAIVIAVSGSPGPKKQSITANQPDAPVTTATHTTVPTESDHVNDEFMTITGGGRSFVVTIDDPATRLVQTSDETSFASQQCVTVTMSTMSGAPIAEGNTCRPLEVLGTLLNGEVDVADTAVDLRPTDGVSVGCAAVDERLPESLSMQQIRARTRFTVSVPATVDPGEYKVEVFGVSGFGDGCATQAELDGQPGPADSTATTVVDDSSQLENTAVARQTVTID